MSVYNIGAMAQLVARPPPERKVGSSSLSSLIIFLARAYPFLI